MNIHNGWKKTAAFLTALTLVVGAMPANVGGFLTGSTGIVANAATVEWNGEEIYGYHEINSDVSVVSDTLSMINGGIVIINGDLTLNNGAEIVLYNSSVLIVNGNINIQGGILIAGDNNCVALSVPGKHLTYNQEAGCYVSDGKTYQFEGTPPRLKEIVHGISIAGATVNLNPDHTVASLTVGEETITDLSGFDITYGTSDNNHTSTTVPTAANTYYAYVTPKSGNINYTGTAKSAAFSIQVGNIKETGKLGDFDWTLDTNDVMTFSGSGKLPPIDFDWDTCEWNLFRWHDNVVKKIVFAPDCGEIVFQDPNDYVGFSFQDWTALEEIEINSNEELHLSVGITVTDKLSKVTVNAPAIYMLEEVPFRSSIPIDLTLNTDALYVDSNPKFNPNVEPSANKVHIPSNSFYVSNGTETKLTKDLYATAFGGATVIAPTTDISSAVLTFDKPSVAYTGNEITPVLTVKYGDKTLTADVDYEIADSSITSATEAGDYTITINGIGDYSGTVSSVWQITTAIYLTKVEATAATGDTAGNVEYYEGSDANYYLLQNGRYKETTLEAVTIPAQEHIFDNIWSWTKTDDGYKAKVIHKCARCGEGQEINAVVSSAEVNGKIVYTANATVDGQELTDIKEIDINYTFAVDGGTITSGEKTSYNYGDAVTVQADAMQDGRYFSGWYIGDTLITTQQSYTFYVKSQNMTVTARYEGNAVAEENADVSVIINRTNIENDRQKVVFSLNWALPQGCTLKEAGILRRYDNAENLTLDKVDGTTIKRHASTLKTRTGNCNFTLTVSATTKVRSINSVAYIIYTDNAGTEHTVLKPVVTSNYNA